MCFRYCKHFLKTLLYDAKENMSRFDFRILCLFHDLAFYLWLFGWQAICFGYPSRISEYSVHKVTLPRVSRSLLYGFAILGGFKHYPAAVSK